MLLRNGLAATDGAVERVAEVLIDAHTDGAELALGGRTLELTARRRLDQ